MAEQSQRQASQQPAEEQSRQRQAGPRSRAALQDLQQPMDPLQRLQALANDSPQVAQLRGLQEIANNSPHTAQLRRLQELANNSPQANEPRQLQAMAQGAERRAKAEPTTKPETVKPKPNFTGLPDQLKSNIEALAGLSMDAVRVHYNSTKPAQLNALAYAQGSDIHLGPGQVRHLPHEAWHVVQQAQGRVRPTLQMAGGVAVNDDAELEREADVMGPKALEGGHRVDETHRSISMPIETSQQIEADTTNSPDTKVVNNDSAPLGNGRGSAQRGRNEVQRIAAQRPEAALQGQVQAWGNGSERVGQLRAWQGVADGREVGGKRQDPTPGFAAMRVIKVHYHSGKPAKLSSDSYAQETEADLAPRQEKHLPHEAWHPEQNMQCTAKPLAQLKQEIVPKDEKSLESELDQMSDIFSQAKEDLVEQAQVLQSVPKSDQVLQRVIEIKDEKDEKDDKIIRNMTDLQREMKWTMHPFGDQGMIRAILKDYIIKPSIITFKSVEEMYSFGAGILENLNAQRNAIEAKELVKFYGMNKIEHPITKENIGYCLVPVHENRPALGDDIANQKYFYRAMTWKEAMTWLNPPGILLEKSGQPWASYASYSREYLRKDKYPILVEIHAPKWLAKAKSLGLYAGKVEAKKEGDMSFGTGAESQSSIRADKKSNAKLTEELINEGLMPLQPNKQKKVTRNSHSETIALSSIYFRESVVSARPIVILS
jgi:hypothetical protein